MLCISQMVDYVSNLAWLIVISGRYAMYLIAFMQLQCVLIYFNIVIAKNHYNYIPPYTIERFTLYALTQCNMNLRKHLQVMNQVTDK